MVPTKKLTTIKNKTNVFLDISYEDAFKIMDQDFDGVVSKGDLKNFIEKELKIQSEELSSTNIDRLYKLMDFSKKGYIYKSDLQRTLVNETTTAWLLNVKQQLGLNISQTFSNLKQSFESHLFCFFNYILF